MSSKMQEVIAKYSDKESREAAGRTVITIELTYGGSEEEVKEMYKYYMDRELDEEYDGGPMDAGTFMNLVLYGYDPRKMTLSVK